MNKLMRKMLKTLKLLNQKFNRCKILFKIISKKFKDYKIN